MATLTEAVRSTSTGTARKRASRTRTDSSRALPAFYWMVWPAVIAHGSLNAAGGLILLVAATQPDMALAGPLGVAAWIVLSVVVVVLVLTGQFRKQPELADAPGRLLSTPRS